MSSLTDHAQFSSKAFSSGAVDYKVSLESIVGAERVMYRQGLIEKLGSRRKKVRRPSGNKTKKAREKSTAAASSSWTCIPYQDA